MRRLLYVPIIHDEADMGIAGAALAQRSTALSVKRRWALHREFIVKFWEGIASYLHTLDESQLKVYQDGLPADGGAGRQIVEEAARRGSKNYKLVLELLRRGAELRMTEDPLLLWQERENIARSLEQEPAGGAGKDFQQHRNRLMEERDKFIARNIGETLREGEVGVLLIGAYHNIVPRLAADISVEPVKDRKKVLAYFEELFNGHSEGKFRELGCYLVSKLAE